MDYGTDIAIIGAQGRLGSALLREAAKHPELSVSVFSHADFDVLRPEQWQPALQIVSPRVIYNCVAYNAVDAAESNADAANALNAEFPKALAEWCAEHGATLVHFSTGYVFDGQDGPYAEDAAPHPISVYGASKLVGEQVVAHALPNHYIVRLNMLFGAPGTGASSSKPSFPEIVLSLAKADKPLRFISDEFSSPTYADDLAAASFALISESHPFGIYHLSNGGQASWLEFAEEVLRLNNISVRCQGIAAAEMSRAAARPHNSALVNRKFPALPDWKEGLAAYYNGWA